MLGISIKLEGLEGVKKLLQNPFTRVMSMSLNTVGEEIFKEQEKIAQSSFKTFSPYTRKSLFMYRTSPTKSMFQQNVVIGSYSSYLRRLEDGFQPRLQTFSNLSGCTVNQDLHGRLIASQLSRKSDGTIKSAYTMKRMQGAFVLDTKYGKIIAKRDGGKLQRLRILKKQVKKVKAYQWHSRAVNNKFKEGKIREMFQKIWNS